MPVIKHKSGSKLLNWTTTVSLDCKIHGQAGMVVTWNRNGQLLQNSSFETIRTEKPRELTISTVAKTQINITYSSDRNVYENFKCTGSSNNLRRLRCKSIYSCSAGYPKSNNTSQGEISVTVTPDLGKKLKFNYVNEFFFTERKTKNVIVACNFLFSVYNNNH